MKVKDFIEMVKNENCVVEIDLPVRLEKRGRMEVEVHETKTSAYDDLSEYYDRLIIGFRKTHWLAPIYKLCDSINGQETTAMHAYRLKIR